VTPGTQPPDGVDVVESVIVLIPHSHGDNVVSNCGGSDLAKLQAEHTGWVSS